MAADLFELVRENVSIFDVMAEFSPTAFAAVRSKEVGHKIPCPFASSRHPKGSDPNPSAKFFPDTQSVYCWSCHGSWDVISFFAEANGMFKEDAGGRVISDAKGPLLDYGRAAGELARRRGLEFKSPDWHQRLRKVVGSLKDAGRQAPPPEQWSRLVSLYTARLLKHPGAEWFGRLDYILRSMPDGGYPGAERDLHGWYSWATKVLDAPQTGSMAAS